MDFEVTHPADEHITDLIETLADRASKFTCKDSDRATYIDEIAKLRSSMKVTINVINQ